MANDARTADATGINYRRILDHMNDDHSSTICDYVRYYGKVDCKVDNASITDISLSRMTIQYDIGKRETITIPFIPPLTEGSQFRHRLIRMAIKAIDSRIPPPALPNVALSTTLVVLLALHGICAFCTDEMRSSFPPPFIMLIQASYQASNVIFFNSVKFKQAAFLAAIVVHVLEGLYVAKRIRRLTESKLILSPRALFWIGQTTLVGFPSLTLFLAKLERLKKGKKSE